MRGKMLVGVAAAALLTLGLGSAVGAATSMTENGNAWVINDPAAGGTAFLVNVDGAPSSFLIDTAGELSVDFGPGGMRGAAVVTPGGDYLVAPRP